MGYPKGILYFTFTNELALQVPLLIKNKNVFKAMLPDSAKLRELVREP